jgi:hypothetical protein
MMIARFALIVTIVALLVSCGAAQPAATAPSTSRPLPTPTPVVAIVPTQPPPPLDTLPQGLIDQAVTDLAQRLGIAPSQITVLVAERLAWPDGSLGCPQKGMLYTQALVEGFRILLVARGVEYAYHGADEGEPFYCEHPAP